MSLSGVSKYSKYDLLKNDSRVLHPFASRFGDIVTVFGVARLPRVWIERTCGQLFQPGAGTSFVANS
jgi:hypothetical protein